MSLGPGEAAAGAAPWEEPAGWSAAPISAGIAAAELPVEAPLDADEQPATVTMTVATATARAAIRSQRARRALGLGTMGASRQQASRTRCEGL